MSEENKNIELNHLKEVMELKFQITNLEIKHTNETMCLTESKNSKALDAAFSASNAKQEESNHKYTLLKDQNNEMNQKFVTVEKFDGLAKDINTMNQKFATNERVDGLGREIKIIAKQMAMIIGGLIVLQILVGVAIKFF